MDQRLFSNASIWRRRPAQGNAVLPYLAMSCLYKRSNRIWHWLIKHDQVHTVWRPLVEWTRRRHLKYRAALALQPASPVAGAGGAVVYAGV